MPDFYICTGFLMAFNAAEKVLQVQLIQVALRIRRV